MKYRALIELALLIFLIIANTYDKAAFKDAMEMSPDVLTPAVFYAGVDYLAGALFLCAFFVVIMLPTRHD